MKIVTETNSDLPDEYVLLVYVIGDAQLILNGKIILTVFEEDGLSVFSNIKQVGTNLASVLNLHYRELEVELDNEDWEDWNMTDILTFIIEELRGE